MKKALSIITNNRDSFIALFLAVFNIISAVVATKSVITANYDLPVLALVLLSNLSCILFALFSKDIRQHPEKFSLLVICLTYTRLNKRLVQVLLNVLSIIFVTATFMNISIVLLIGIETFVGYTAHLY